MHVGKRYGKKGRPGWITLCAALSALSLDLLSGGAPLETAQAATDATGNAAAQQSSTTGTLLALGDSISYGYNLGDNQAPSAEAFPFGIGAQEQLSVDDLAIPGETSDQLLASLAKSSLATELASAKLITLDIGSNDLLRLATPLLVQAASGKTVSLTSDQRAEFDAAVQHFSNTFPAILEAIGKHASAPVLVYNLYDPVPSTLSLHTVAETYIREENDIIAKAVTAADARGSGSPFLLVNAYDVFAGHLTSYILPLDVHPSVAGQQALAKAGELVLKAYLAGQPGGGEGDVTGSVYGSSGSNGQGGQAAGNGSEGTGTSPGTVSPPSGGQVGGPVGGRFRWFLVRA
ncbi:MAG: hypothetical protein K6T83_09025 [Alicyclobacillus sp.]|nr:hypothetical protein [Alicyclobacillus sp.]